MTQDKNKDKIAKIARHASTWENIIKFSPMCFLGIIVSLLYLNIFTNTTIFYISATFFILLCIVWWIWVIRSVRFLINCLSDASVRFYVLKEVIHEFKKELEEFKNDIK